MTATGATLRFASEALIALTGAGMPATLDGQAVVVLVAPAYQGPAAC